MTGLPVATLTELLCVRAESLGARPAYVFLADGETETATLTYAALDRRARRLARILRARVAPGTSVLLAFPAGLEFVVAFFACAYAGVVAVPVCAPHPRKGNERLAAIAADSGARLVLTTASGARHHAVAATQVAALGELQVMAIELDAADDLDATATTLVTPSPDAIALLQYTSGSTQRPRGVMVTHANLLANLAAIHAAEGNGTESKGVCWLPAYHDMGLIEGILQPLYGGYPTWLMPHAAFLQRPARWLAAITRHGATVSGGPNFAYDLCLRRVSDAELERLDLSRWQVAYCGAEPVRAETLEAFAARYARCGLRRSALRPVYGLAESTLLVTASRADAPGPRIIVGEKRALEQGRFAPAAAATDDRSLLVSCGVPVPGTRIVIVAPDTRAPLPERAVGEIWVSGPGVASGYRSQTGGHADTFVAQAIAGVAGTWLCTGDLGFLHEGELYITGRAKDLIILRGRKLHPQDIEHTVACSEARTEVDAVVAFALEGEGGEGLAICAELGRAGRFARMHACEPALAQASDTIRDHVYREHDVAVATVAFVRPGALARTTSGKLMRYRCRADFMAARLPIVACFDARVLAAPGAKAA